MLKNYVRCSALMLGLMGVGSVFGVEAWKPAILESGAKHFLPDYSYAGYHNGDKELPVLKPTLNVTDFGAVADDEVDDTDAVKKALAHAASLEGAQVIGFPKGKFIISDVLVISHSNLVLQGQGSGENGTVLYFSKALKDMPPQPEHVEMLEYMKKNNKRENGKLYTPYSWSGGVIWTKLNRPEKIETLTAVLSGSRGQSELTVSDASSLKSGMSVMLQWFNKDGENGSFLKHLYMSDDPQCGKKVYSNAENALVQQPVTIVSVEGNTVTVKEPLLHDIKEGWTPQLVSIDALEEVGIEHLKIEFAHAEYGGHHTEDGYNGIYLTAIRNSWVKDVVVHNTDAAVVFNGWASTSLITLDGLKMTGRLGHYSIKMSGYGNLVKNFDFSAPALHNPSFCSGSKLCVYTCGTVQKPQLDQHAGINHQNLFDNLKLLGLEGKLFKHGGAKYWMPVAGAFNTFWNLYVEGENDLKGLKGKAWHARIVGLHGKETLKLQYDDSAYIEGMNKKNIAVPSLYDYQLLLRAK